MCIWLARAHNRTSFNISSSFLCFSDLKMLSLHIHRLQVVLVAVISLATASEYSNLGAVGRVGETHRGARVGRFSSVMKFQHSFWGEAYTWQTDSGVEFQE